VTVPNPSANPIDVFILVDGYSTGSGAFSVTTSTAAIPYTKTTIATACTDMTGATAVPGTLGDEATSAIIPLPSAFAFSFFGTAATHYSVTSNGYAQLWPSATGTPVVDYANTPIPGSSVPHNFVAPFWDDLMDVTATAITTHTTGSGSNRVFTIQWADTTPYASSAGPERFTFQAQLYETSNVIEFHYCTMAANGGSATRTTGNSATIGLENATGTIGVQHSHNTATSVSPANALRFTP
jgi:hypothetical protein